MEPGGETRTARGLRPPCVPLRADPGSAQRLNLAWNDGWFGSTPGRIPAETNQEERTDAIHTGDVRQRIVEVWASSCVEEDDGSDTAAVDADEPVSGGVFYYLARAENACPSGLGSLGAGSDGSLRTGRVCP